MIKVIFIFVTCLFRPFCADAKSKKKFTRDASSKNIKKGDMSKSSHVNPNNGPETKKRIEKIKKKRIKPPKYNTNSNPNFNFSPKPQIQAKEIQKKNS